LVTRLNRFTAIATRVVVNNAYEKTDIIPTAIDHMSFFSHHFNETVRISTARANQSVFSLLNCNFHLQCFG